VAKPKTPFQKQAADSQSSDTIGRGGAAQNNLGHALTTAYTLCDIKQRFFQAEMAWTGFLDWLKINRHSAFSQASPSIKHRTEIWI
jgi:hypothetical protein